MVCCSVPSPARRRANLCPGAGNARRELWRAISRPILRSGEAVAHHTKVTPLTAEQVGITSTCWNGETLLWYYILREADACTGGHRLGPVGGQDRAGGARRTPSWMLRFS
jgi:hypothetical protein